MSHVVSSPARTDTGEAMGDRIKKALHLKFLFSHPFSGFKAYQVSHSLCALICKHVMGAS